MNSYFWDEQFTNFILFFVIFLFRCCTTLTSKHVEWWVRIGRFTGRPSSSKRHWSYSRHSLQWCIVGNECCSELISKWAIIPKFLGTFDSAFRTQVVFKWAKWFWTSRLPRISSDTSIDFWKPRNGYESDQVRYLSSYLNHKMTCHDG